MTNKDKILEVLAETSPMAKKDIIEKSGIKKSSSGVFLKQLKKAEMIENLSYGQYSITEKGRGKIQKIQNTDGKKHHEKKIDIKQSEHSDSTFDDIDFIIQLKKRYGNEDLIKRLRKMIKLLE